MTTWTDYLAGRGISAKTITRYKMHGATYENRFCVRFPTIGYDATAIHRVKFIDGAKPKIKWDGWLGENGQTNWRYYSPGGLKDAIAKQGGLLYWLSGEPDVWTWYEARGLDNSTCSFGEGSIPDTIADDLKALGVTCLVMYPDLDSAGMKAAGKLWRLLQDSGITLHVRRIAGKMESKRDLNQLWQDEKFSVDGFNEAIDATTLLSDTDLELHSQEDNPKASTLKLPLSTNDHMFNDWIELIIQSLGSHAAKEGRVLRWHCPLPNHPDRNPSFRIADGDRCKMPICTCGIQNLEPVEAWNAVAQAQGMDTWEEYKTRQRAERGQIQPVTANAATPPMRVKQAAPPIPPAEPFDMDSMWVDSHTVYQEILDHLEGENIPDIEFIQCPLTCLHEFGGFARVMFPGKLTYIVGVSGGGKTSMAETMAEKFLRQGYDFVWYGPEWTPYEMGLRSLQRAGSVKVEHMADYLTYQLENKRGVPDEKRLGKALSKGEISGAMKAMGDLGMWPGRAMYLKPESNKLPLSDMLNVVRYMVTKRRAEGRRVVAFFFDYLQRANKKGRESAYWSEEVIGEIKSLCEELQLVGFVVVQPRKGDSRSARDNELLNESSGQGISDQQCNLFLTVSPVFDAEGEMTSNSVIKIVKNSMGRKGQVTITYDWQRLLVVDRKVPTVQVDLSKLNGHKKEVAS